MKRQFFAVGVAMAISGGAFAAQGDGTVLGSSVDHLRMKQLDKAPDGEEPPGLIGGQPATRDEYPGVFYTAQGNSRCTGTVIGERVVASAAHCMSDGGRLTLTYKNETYTGTCAHAPRYRGNPTADWALCLLDRSIPDAIAESVNVDGTRLQEGLDIVLMGFGCTGSGGGGGNDGTLRVGRAPITSLPTESQGDFDIVTSGDSALCYGDSGGPSFVVTSDGSRYQTGINSRGDISRTSYLSSVHVAEAQSFYRDWSARNGVKICGVDAGASRCRQSPGPEMPAECKTVTRDGHAETLARCAANSTSPTPAQCETALTAVRACLAVRS